VKIGNLKFEFRKKFAHTSHNKIQCHSEPARKNVTFKRKKKEKFGKILGGCVSQRKQKSALLKKKKVNFF